MSIPVSQIVTASYNAVLNEMRTAEDQWSENAALRMLEKQGCVEKIDFGPQIEMALDYRPNPDMAILANDQDEISLLKTEIMTAALFDIAQISEGVTWTKGDEVKNPSVNQKVALVKQLLKNGINSHDDLIEQAIFTTTSGGGVELNGLDTLVPTSGQGTVGGIDASVETWWRNPADTYTDATDIEASFLEVLKEAQKGTGSSKGPKFMLSGATPHSLFESVLQAQQRFADVKEADRGFKVIMFHSLPYGYSQYGGNNVYFLSPESYKLLVSKSYFRDKSDTIEIPNQNAFSFKIYSALQFVTKNKSRNAVVSL
jgi:hypothetical protein